MARVVTGKEWLAKLFINNEFIEETVIEAPTYGKAWEYAEHDFRYEYDHDVAMQKHEWDIVVSEM